MKNYDYIINCLGEHIERMIASEDKLKQEIAIKKAELEILTSERTELQVGLNNWLDESEIN